VRIGPAREFLFDTAQAGEAAPRIVEAAERQARRLRKAGAGEAADALVKRVEGHLEKLREGVYFEGIDQYKPFFHPELVTLLSYVGRGVVIVDEPAKLKEQMQAFDKDLGEAHAALL